MKQIVSGQQNAYRRGLVLGLTMAEVMLLLVFTLLIAAATMLNAEKQRYTRLEKQLENANTTLPKDSPFRKF